MFGAIRGAVLGASVCSLIGGVLIAGPASASPQPSQHSAVSSRAARSQKLPVHSLTPAPGSNEPNVAASSTPTTSGMVRATVSGSAASVQRAVTGNGGKVLTRAGSAASVLIPAGKLAALSAASGVSSVRRTERPRYDTVGTGPSQAVAATGANTWQTAGTDGTGVTVALIDGSFGDTQSQYDAEVAAGHLGTTPTLINEDCTDANNLSTPYNGDSHGIATAEQLHQQAPGAHIVMYCVGSPTGSANALTDLEGKGIRIVSSSLAWFRDSRGDGSAPAGSMAAVVAAARKAGVLWINSAGNYGLEHWSGSLVDTNRDGIIDMGNATSASFPYESNFYAVAPGSVAAPTSIDFNLQWDQWGTTPSRLWLRAYGLQCTAADGSGGNDNCQGVWITPSGGISQESTGSAVDGPVDDLATDAYHNTSQYPQIWEVQIVPAGSYPSGVRYDLVGLGDVDGASALSCPTQDSAGNCIVPNQAAQGSVTSPANSPYALAVGAVDVGADGTTPGTFEPYSSQGPTIDGRPKPEIAAWDGVSSYLSDFSNGFYGTSASAPEVAGAAALVAQNHSTWDASQLQNFLEQRANSGQPINPPNNTIGHGKLTLGDPATIALPLTAGYLALTPQRILDTRTTIGGHNGPVGPFSTVTVTLPSTVPPDATAVSINLTGVYPTASTFLAAYPGGKAWPGSSNLNLVPKQTAAVSATVSIANRSITVLNAAGYTHVLIDLLGYYAPSATNGYTAVTPNRVVDTRPESTIGGRSTKLGNGDTLTVQPAVPAGATAVVVNITSTRGLGSGYLSAAASCTNTTSTLNWTSNTRANLAVVGLDPSGNFCLEDSGNSTDVLVDVFGYLAPATGAKYVALPTPTRVLDTRSNNGVPNGNGTVTPIASMGGVFGTQGGVGDVPASATALVAGLTATNERSVGWLSAVPASVTGTPSVSTLNYLAGANVPNATFISLPGQVGSQYRIFNGSTATADGIVDLFGYFLP